MTMTFEDWLKESWLDDENRKSTKVSIDKIRTELKEKILPIYKVRSVEDDCCCDVCILACLLNEKQLIKELAFVGIQYLLGENFNSAAAAYYCSFIKENAT